jgi:hypothetical protein
MTRNPEIEGAIQLVATTRFEDGAQFIADDILEDLPKLKAYVEAHPECYTKTQAAYQIGSWPPAIEAAKVLVDSRRSAAVEGLTKQLADETVHVGVPGLREAFDERA